MFSADVFKGHAQRVMACVSLLLCLGMLVEIIRKIRCGAKIRIKRKQYDHQSMTVTQELTIYAFYGLATLWSLSYILCFSIFPLSRSFGSSADIHSLCQSPVAVLSGSTVLYQIALVNILTDRLQAAFQRTGDDLSKCTNDSIRIGALLVWGSFFLYLIVVLIPAVFEDEEGFEFPEDGDCLNDDDRSKTAGAVLMALSLFSTLALWLLLMVKLAKFRTILFRDDAAINGDHRIVKMMKKQSIIMLWVTVTTLFCTALHLIASDHLGRAPFVLDYMANAVALFLAYSFNETWYARCRCNQCVLCLVKCLWNRSRLDEVATIELNLQRAAELAMQSVPRGPDERPAAGNEDSGRPQSDHEIEDKGAMGGGLEMEEDDSIAVALSPSKYNPNDLELDVAPKTATKKILDEADRRKNDDAISESQCTKQLTCGLDADRTSARMERVGLPPLDQPAKDKVPRSDCKEEDIPAVNVKMNPLGLEMVMSQSSEWNGSTHSSPPTTKGLEDATLPQNQSHLTKDAICVKYR